MRISVFPALFNVSADASIPGMPFNPETIFNLRLSSFCSEKCCGCRVNPDAILNIEFSMS